jgi:HlyD family secretion protein
MRLEVPMGSEVLRFPANLIDDTCRILTVRFRTKPCSSAYISLDAIFYNLLNIMVLLIGACLARYNCEEGIMDRPIDDNYRRNQMIKRFALGIPIGLAALALIAWVPGWIQPSVSRSRVRIARVSSGAIEATLTSAGTVVPEFEQVLSSPIESRVLKILKRPGSALRKGEAILELDVSQSVLELNKFKQQLAIKQNQQAQRRLELENTLIKLQSLLVVKKLDLKSFQLQLKQQQRLWEVGLTSEGQLRRAEVQEETAQTEVKQLEEEKVNAGKATQAQLEGLTMEIKSLQQEQEEAQRQLDLATTRADRDGVLTWVVLEEGSAVHKGDVIARIADLNSFRVDAKISDVYAAKLTVGMPAKVKIDEQYLQGTIANILPTIKDGVMTLQIGLEEKTSRALRANLRVDVFLVTDHKDRTLRIQRGPFVNGEGNHPVFVVRSDMAVKTPVTFGIADFDSIEIVSGLIEGDEVIISDMADYQNLKQVKLK